MTSNWRSNGCSLFLLFLILTLARSSRLVENWNIDVDVDLKLGHHDPIVFDDSAGLGRVFEGIGAISGGGATSKLLVNYEPKYRDEILDYLFKPNFGASLQIFKVEIGGDMQSTDGTEASHMHEAWDENYERGYEWWLIQEAKKRNPDIKLYGLPWGFPGWIGQGTNSPYTNPDVTSDYIARWINAAKKIYGYDIDYIGIWNERSYDITYIKTLRKTLDDRGFKNTQIIAADNGWGISQDIEKDKDLADIIHAIGCHYPGTTSSDDAEKTQKPLWASEDYSTFNDETGGGCWARILNQNYVNGNMTSTISWNLIGSYYDGLPFYRDGLMTAAEPWSGHYNVSTPIWITAHTTQFVPIGQRYLQHESGVGHLPEGGSYVSFTNDKRDELTILLETMSHDHSVCIRPSLPAYNVSQQTVELKLKGSFSKITSLNVWHSKLGFDGAQNVMFEQLKAVDVKDGKVTLDLDIDEIYTLTTATTGQKGSFPDPPASQPFPAYIHDDFSKYKEHEEPYLLAPQAGSLEIVTVGGRKVARQPILNVPVYWCNADTLKPVSIVGNHSWSGMSVVITFDLPEVNATDGVFVAVRVDQGGCSANKALGLFFFVFPVSNKFIVAGDIARTQVIEEGYIDPKTGLHSLALSITDTYAIGSYDGIEKFYLNDISSLPESGFAAIGTDSFGLADFYSFELESLDPSE